MPCVEPKRVLQFCADHDLPTPWLGKPNRFACPAGREKGTGWVLMARQDYAKLDVNGLHSLEFSLAKSEVAGVPKGRYVVVLKNLLVVKSESVTPGLEGDPHECLLVELADIRHVCKAIPIDRGYNLRAVPDGTYYASSTLGGTPWTWAEMLAHLWETVGTDRLGTFPGLPFTPDGTPDGFAFWAMSAWDALCDALERIACAVVPDPLAGTWSIVQVGAPDAAAEAALEKWKTVRIWDAYFEESVRGRIPSAVRVLFRQLPNDPGTSPYYPIAVADPTADAVSSGFEPDTQADLFDDLPAVYNASGVLQNLPALTSRATERARDYYRELWHGFNRLTRIFGVPLSDRHLLPGRRIRATSWYDVGTGMKTEVDRYPDGTHGVDLDPNAPFDYPFVNETLNTYNATLTNLTITGTLTLPGDNAVRPMLFVRMRTDAVADNHPDFQLGISNAVVQRKNFVTGDWEDTARRIWVTVIDGLNSNGRLPLRKDDRFWVMLTPPPANQWVPTYAPRTSGVYLTGDFDFEGLYVGFTLVFNEATLQDEFKDQCHVYDPSGLGLDPGYYAGCDLIGHRDGVCIYRATCCVGLASGSGASGSAPSGSGSITPPVPCPCVAEVCNPCGAGTLSFYMELKVQTSCVEFTGVFLLSYVGSCTWQTSTFVDQRAQGGKYGPTWALKPIAGEWHIFAAGTDIGILGVSSGCNLPIIFATNARSWTWAKGRTCDFIGETIIDPLCDCPQSGSGSGSISGSGACPQICDQCGATHYAFSVPLEGFGDAPGEGCPDSCINTPAEWDFDVTGATGGAVDLEGHWTATGGANCDWIQDRANGSHVVVHTSGTSTLAVTFTGATCSCTYNAPITLKDCCSPLVLTQVSFTGTGTMPASITVTPHCEAASTGTCSDMNVGTLLMTNGANCYWQGTLGGVTATWTFDGTFWDLTLSSPSGHSATYRSSDGMCCGDHDLQLQTSDCDAPATLTVTALGACDNCPTDQWYCVDFSSGSGSGSGEIVDACCPPDAEAFISPVTVTVTGSAHPLCMPNGVYAYVWRGGDPAYAAIGGPCCWFEISDPADTTPGAIKHPWFFGGGSFWEFKFENYASFCPGAFNGNPAATDADCATFFIHLAAADCGGEMDIVVQG